MATPYNMAFACFNCCKSFKREFDFSKKMPEEIICPECGGKAHNLGRHFKAPQKTNQKQWAKVKYLFEHGFRFQKIRIKPDNISSIPYPETLKEAKKFVVKYQKYAIKEIISKDN